ncbi:hypothetical protein GSI_14386 [Ganoderma sinense ZZ0214-1]|uniref:Uncharacterized protein n=1 Tax=Ganoderma sinense ZZ0214-1 TaxID=1077348 RepID=A0A2G8RP16_9APHY|nr:hypothetical protein GSI_14386 [Ganoderma sinense ZZ0214-1]
MDSPPRMKDYMDSPPRIQDYMHMDPPPTVIQDDTDSHPTIQDDHMDSHPTVTIQDDHMDSHPTIQDVMDSPPITQGNMVAPRSEFLPIELIEEVIDRASHDPKSLRALSLLCKDLLTRARIHLFTGIAIRSVEEMDTSREFLDSHSWVLPLVRRVTLSSCVETYTADESKKLNFIPVLDIFQICGYGG